MKFFKVFLKKFFPLIFSLSLPLFLFAQDADYDRLKGQAEEYYKEGSYQMSHDIYLKLDSLELPAEEGRWVDFRLADTLWRAQAATQTSDSTKFEQAEQALEALVRDVQRDEDKDRVWAETEESLGDFWWLRRDFVNWYKAWPYYERGLDFWAGAKDIELGRSRYIGMVWKIARPAWSVGEDYYCYGDYGNTIPSQILENVIKIAEDKDKVYAHYLLAMTFRYSGNYEELRRAGNEFNEVIKSGKQTDFYDDALYHYAHWLIQRGEVVLQEDGNWRQEPNYVKAVELLQKLTNEFKKGETRYFDEAKEKIKEITKPDVNVNVDNIFLPDSEIQFHLNWRNTSDVQFTLYKTKITESLSFYGKDTGSNNWLEYIDISWSKRVKSWLKKVEDKGDYKPRQELVRLDEKLGVGAYILEVQAADVTRRELILVTDSSLVVKASGKQALVYFCNTFNGAPIANAGVKLWKRIYDGSSYVWGEMTNKTNKDGLCVFDLSDSKRSNIELFVAAGLGDRQAFSLGNNYCYYRDKEQWKIYAFCDRPAYRPKETVQWKFIAREYINGQYSTPANQIIEFQINDPQGSKVKEGKGTLNSFGSFWGDLELTEIMPLGEYKVSFWDDGRSHYIGEAILFRLEEYKLPEFKVEVKTPQENGKKKTFCLGDTVEAEIQVDYYFGGPLANADVEVLVYQSHYCHFWQDVRDYPWLYEDMVRQENYYYGHGQVIKRDKLKTDATGKARVKFDTPRGSADSFEYRIEARVIDSSRREVVGSDAIRVSRQSYYVYLTNKHNLYQPQDKVEIDIKALDVNNQPQEVEGRVKVTRDFWFEVWLSPDGEEVKGEELKRLRQKNPLFPPAVLDSNKKPWQLKQGGYEHEDILVRTVKTDSEGNAEFTFIPEQEGYYRIEWSSQDRRKTVIKAETTIWAAVNATTDLGYRHAGVEIIVDKDTFVNREKAAVMLTVPASDSYVLFSVEADDIYNYQVIHLGGTVKLLELPIEEKYTPNIFLNAVMVRDNQLFMDTKQVVIPPVEHFLNVEVKSDQQEYEPQNEGEISVSVVDHQGKPVSGEVALGLVDEAVYYIQKDYASDPRQFFYGDKREQLIQTQSSFYQKRYVKLVEGKEGKLVDEFKYDREELRRGYLTGEGKGGEADYASIEGLEESTVGTKRAVMMHKSREVKDEMVQENEEAPLSPPPPPGEEPAVQVRSDFRSTIFWQPNIVTDKEGKANIKVKFADTLTSWKALSRVTSQSNQFGIASTTMRTKKPLIVRLQAPRFFVVGDTVLISAVINNNTSEDLSVTPYLDAKGIEITGIVKDGIVVKGEYGNVLVPARGEVRVDWNCIVEQQGEAKLTVTAKGNKYSDAMQKIYHVYEHGIERFLTKSGKTSGNDITVKLDIPSQRKKESTELSVQVTPSMAVTMMDALPYLIDYPYGCTEQTMSRFLPAAIVAKTLNDVGIKPQVVMKKIFGGIEEEYLDKTHPQGKKELSKLDDIVEKGLSRLYDFQHSDGGWGWWKEGDSDHFMTAYVVWGLSLAESAGIEVKDDVLSKALNYLDDELVEEELNFDMQAWMLHALSLRQEYLGIKARASSAQGRAFENLWSNRDKLNAYSRALLALSAYYTFGDKEKAQVLVRNLVNGVQIDKNPDVSVIQNSKQAPDSNVITTAHWGEDGIYWHWSEGGVEATAFVLQALLTIDPQNQLIEPVTNWLIKNRRGSQWSNTRDTAIVILALNRYLQQSEELQTDVEYELMVNGSVIARKSISCQEVFNAPSRFYIDSTDVKDGVNEIRIKRIKGDTPLYFAVQAKFFSLEEPVTSSGNEIFVHRQYYKLVGRPTLLKGYVYDKQPLSDGETVTSQERVETVITIETKNNYEYLVFEDLKPAGLEAVEIRSGQPLYTKQLKEEAVNRLFGKEKGNKETDDAIDYTGQSRGVYQELRDRKVALFIDKLPQGVWEIRYDMRAEVPGKFHALPLIGYAMYVPEIRANGQEVRIVVEDKE